MWQGSARTAHLWSMQQQPEYVEQEGPCLWLLNWGQLGAQMELKPALWWARMTRQIIAEHCSSPLVITGHALQMEDWPLVYQKELGLLVHISLPPLYLSSLCPHHLKTLFPQHPHPLIFYLKTEQTDKIIRDPGWALFPLNASSSLFPP